MGVAVPRGDEYWSLAPRRGACTLLGALISQMSLRRRLISQLSPAEALGVADVPTDPLGNAFFLAENLVMQRSPAENLLTQRSPAGLNCHHSVPLRSSLGNAAPPCEAPFLCHWAWISNSRRHGNLRPEGQRRHTAAATCEEREMHRGGACFYGLQLCFLANTSSAGFSPRTVLAVDAMSSPVLNHELDDAVEWIANHVAADSTTTVHSIWVCSIPDSQKVLVESQNWRSCNRRAKSWLAHGSQ
ncbi:hypothetical protein N7478_010155 [Penicillium angulare]|uniref:uncharacterized protein n=1 Tax=Penicillium angulare TaxID=116970 RepID=UPI00253FDE06|nr:uncharacterized protein N7478_010155 [Penicillium angulare]KAJ5267347.1 hypothetical protein N7478_010155 [Penicillium angulare]